jgi:predicted ester cyclase
MQTVQRAFPGIQNKTEELIAERDKVVARLTYTGTHHGELFGIEPTGRRVTYSGVAIFRISDGAVVEGWVLGDTGALMRQLEE